MKYFTRDYVSGALSDKEREKVLASWRKYNDAMLLNLPGPVLALANGISLHDGVGRRVVVDKGNGELLLELRCGDLPRGYFDADIKYIGVDFESVDLVGLSAIARNSKAELIFDEVDISTEKRFIHRAIFQPEGEFSITFSRLDLKLTSQVDRSFDVIKEVYQEV